MRPTKSAHCLAWLLVAIVLAVLIDCSIAATEQRTSTRRAASPATEYAKQFITDPESRETDPPNFVRLAVMRLIYGIAAQMGVEDRLSGVLNGIFVPPNAEDDDDYGGGFGDDVGGFGGADDLFDF